MSAYNINDFADPIEYVTTDGVHHFLVPVSQMGATLVTQESDPEEYQKDMDGVTDPNLHRRIDTESEDSYSLVIRKLHSYRTRTYTTHDEDSETCEIP